MAIRRRSPSASGESGGAVERGRIDQLVHQPIAHRGAGRHQPVRDGLPVVGRGDRSRLGGQRLQARRAAVEVGVEGGPLLGAHARPCQLVGRILVRPDPGHVPLHPQLVHRLPEEDDVGRQPMNGEEGRRCGPDAVCSGGDQVLPVPSEEQHRRHPLPRGANLEQEVAELLGLPQAHARQAVDLHHQGPQPWVDGGTLQTGDEAEVGIILADPEQPQRGVAPGQGAGEVEARHLARPDLEPPVARRREPGGDDVVGAVRSASQRVADAGMVGVDGERHLPEPGIAGLPPALGHRGAEANPLPGLDLGDCADPAVVQAVESGELPVRAQSEARAPRPDANREFPGTALRLVADVLQRHADGQRGAGSAEQAEVPGVRARRGAEVGGVDVERRPQREQLSADRERIRRLPVAAALVSYVRAADPVEPYAERHPLEEARAEVEPVDDGVEVQVALVLVDEHRPAEVKEPGGVDLRGVDLVGERRVGRRQRRPELADRRGLRVGQSG